MPEKMTIGDLARAVKQFNKERDWGCSHTPKNLAMALMVEAGELAGIFIWLTPEESEHLSSEALVEVNEELGDVMICILNLAQRLGIDPLEAARKKSPQVSAHAPFLGQESVHGSTKHLMP